MSSRRSRSAPQASTHGRQGRSRRPPARILSSPGSFRRGLPAAASHPDGTAPGPPSWPSTCPASLPSSSVSPLRRDAGAHRSTRQRPGCSHRRTVGRPTVAAPGERRCRRHQFEGLHRSGETLRSGHDRGQVVHAGSRSLPAHQFDHVRLLIDRPHLRAAILCCGGDLAPYRR